MVVVEDVQWAEPTFLELIEYLPMAIGSVPVLIIAVTRAELFDIRPNFAQGLPGARRIEVEPLSEGDSQALVEQLVGEAGVATGSRIGWPRAPRGIRCSSRSSSGC